MSTEVETALTPYQFDRAKRFDHVLGRLRQSEALYDHYQEQGVRASIAWIAPPGEKHRVDIDPNLIRALKGVAVTLFRDLKAEGEEVLALDLVDQHRLQADAGSTQDEQRT